MNNNISIKTLSFIFILSIAGYGCSESQTNKRAEQAKILQQSISTIASACIGTLSLSIELTGNIEKPAITTVNCSEMDKKHEFFRELTDKDVDELKNNIKKLN